MGDEIEFDSDDAGAVERLEGFWEDEKLRVSACIRLESDYADIRLPSSGTRQDGHHPMRFLRALQFRILVWRQPQRVDLRFASATYDLREANRLFTRVRHGSSRGRRHRSIFASPLTVWARLPCTQQAQGGKEPENQRRQPSNRKAGETQDDEEHGESGEKEVHVKKVTLYAACAMGQTWP